MEIKKAILGPAGCSLDLGDGSERGKYVSQEYILNRLGRPHRAVSLMYCYYPLDKGWPLRARDAFKEMKVSGAWDYPYEDYFPYEGGIGGTSEGEPFRSMRDIRQYGQDVILTLTVDPELPDCYLRAVAEDLRPFGRMYLRVNHEASGNWFAYSRRASYSRIADFYIRFHKIIKETAPNIKTIFCTEGVKSPDGTQIEKESDLSSAVVNTDIWSVDQYFSLHWSWPNDIAETGSFNFLKADVNDIYHYMERTYKRFLFLNGNDPKPMFISELNADGDVSGPYEQAQAVENFYEMIEKNRPEWISGICMYQFRDNGRLGLEIQSRSDPETGISTPLLETYKRIIKRPFFSPSLTVYPENCSLPLKMRWGSSEDAEGISIKTELTSSPVFMEMYFNENDNNNYMIHFNGKWFHKSPETNFVDLIPAFFEKPFVSGNDYSITFFSPPSGGENDISSENGCFSYFTEFRYLPEIRIRYFPVSY